MSTQISLGMFHEQSLSCFQCVANIIPMEQEIAIEDLVILHMYQWEALMRVLERKGFLTNMEVMEEIESLKLEHEAAMERGPEAKDGLPGG